MNADPLITYRRKPGTLDRSAIESLASFAETLRRRVARGREFHCLITGDAELRTLNRTWRNKDYPTDVLSFEDTQDIAISLARARAQAKACGHSTEDELRILMLHGVLHLRGMDHESDQGQMQRSESRWRRILTLPPTLIGRAPRDTRLSGASTQAVR
jgi:probable rRNA maturation factor